MADMVTYNLRVLCSGSPKPCVSALKCIISLCHMYVVSMCLVNILKCSDAIIMRTTRLLLKEVCKCIIFQMK